MDVARINFSHGTHDTDGFYISAIRRVARSLGTHVPIMQDLAGPRMETATGHALDPQQRSGITDKDLADLEFGIKNKVDYIAQSYVGGADDVLHLKAEIKRRSAETPIIAKIERQEAVDRFDDILKVADAIMIARGDLGLAVPIEDIPFLERDMIVNAKRAGKPVITATQMMYTMVEHPEPTRAEVTDVAYAIVLGSDAVMLSDETARGAYPVQAVAMMERIVSRAERAGQTMHVNPL